MRLLFHFGIIPTLNTKTFNLRLVLRIDTRHLKDICLRNYGSRCHWVTRSALVGHYVLNKVYLDPISNCDTWGGRLYSITFVIPFHANFD